MANPKFIVENIKYRIHQTRKLLNKKDKTSEAYRIISNDLRGLEASLRVAETSLRFRIQEVSKSLTLAQAQLKTASSDTERNKIEKEILKLTRQLKALE